MCGIAGVLELSGRTDDLESSVRTMTETLRHRGPDDMGVWVDPAAGVGLGVRRLAIVDLSREGHQPMRSASGRYVIAFNGEIYNFPALRRELDGLGHRFRGRSDTEVMLAALDQWGLEGALRRFNGMFAFALHDGEQRVLHLARDRLGEKPLYFAMTGPTLVFGSELKAIRAHPSVDTEIDPDALAMYLRYKYVPAPWSIYGSVRKLPPGTVLTIDGRSPGTTPEPRPYWSARDAVERGIADPFAGSADEAADHLDELLRQAVGMRMVADVSLGAFLSGGVDSSTVVALMQAQSDRPVKTFTIGFHEASYNEARDAKAVAEHLGTDHTELYVTPDEAMAVIPRLHEIYDEPFADSSQIPTFLVSELARRDVTVSLSGDGGDEVFGGYNRYLWGGTVLRRTRWMPRGMRAVAAGALASVSPGGWDRFLSAADPLLPGSARQRNAGEKLHKLARALRASGPDDMYRSFVSHWEDPDAVVLGASEPAPEIILDGSPEIGEFTQRMMYLDTITYLPDDILVKLDRATMSVSLEGRVPYLDHRVVEFAWRLPLAMKVRDGQGKRILRDVLYRYVPRNLIERPKTGFGPPIDTWLRGPLRDWAESLLDGGRLRREGFFDPRPIRSAWADHLSGRHNRQYELWDVLMFQSWLEANTKRGALLS